MRHPFLLRAYITEIILAKNFRQYWPPIKEYETHISIFELNSYLRLQFASFFLFFLCQTPDNHINNKPRPVFRNFFFDEKNILTKYEHKENCPSKAKYQKSCFILLLRLFLRSSTQNEKQLMKIVGGISFLVFF